ncbi:MAG: hypothetical protein ACOVQR_08655 [Flavobacterium sp.]|jgi:hypothetical protein|uniref:hypothetical protein n=1 Tax=Flavobacterium sp. TaxID=239 RepID=UPI003BA6872C
MKRVLFLIISVCSLTDIYSQTFEERKRAISIIEDLTYNEYYFDIKCYDKTDISFDPNTSKVEIISTSFLGEDINIVAKTTFYITDLDLSTFKTENVEMDDKLFFPSIRIKAVKGSITTNIVSVNKRKHIYPMSETKYFDELVFNGNKKLPQSQLDKLILNFKTLLGIKSK